jgi:hypothetical protein
LFLFQFQKPKEDTDYPELAKEALIKALDDAGISINQVQQACCGYVYGKKGSILCNFLYYYCIFFSFFIIIQKRTKWLGGRTPLIESCIKK